MYLFWASLIGQALFRDELPPGISTSCRGTVELYDAGRSRKAAQEGRLRI
jgi:hypothetical protein